MKKRISIVLTALYLAFNLGVVVNAHFCGGGLKSLTFYDANTGCKACGSKKNDNKCCKNTSDLLIVDESHQSVHNDFEICAKRLLESPFLMIKFCRHVEFSFTTISNSTFADFLWGPIKVPVFILFRSILV